LVYAALGIAASPLPTLLVTHGDLWNPAAWGAGAAAIFWVASAMRARLARATTTTTSAIATRSWRLAAITGLGFALVFGAVSYVSTVCRVVLLDADWGVFGELWNSENYRQAQLEWWSLPLDQVTRAPMVLALMSGCLGTSVAVAARVLGQESRSKLIRFGGLAVGCFVLGAVCWLPYVASFGNSRLLVATLVHSFDWALLVASLSVALAWGKRTRAVAVVWLAVAVAAVVSVRFVDLSSEKMELLRRSAWEPVRSLFLLVQATLACAVVAARAEVDVEAPSARFARVARVSIAGLVASGCLLLQMDGQTWFEAIPLEGDLTPTATCKMPEETTSIVVDPRHRHAPGPAGIHELIRNSRRPAQGAARPKLELLAPLNAPVTGLVESLAVAGEHGYDLAIVGERFEEIDLITLAPFRVRKDRCVLLQTPLQRLAHGTRPPANVNTVSGLVAWLNAP
jgi:hypothetical protein